MSNFVGSGTLLIGLLCGCAAEAPPASLGTPPATTAPPAISPAPAARPAPGASNGEAAPPAHYRCEGDTEFTVRFEEDSAVLAARPGGSEVLLRDAGGVTPQQTVYSNARMRAEFGLGANGREAILRYAAPPVVAHCVME